MLVDFNPKSPLSISYTYIFFLVKDFDALCFSISNKHSLQTNLFENALDNTVPSIPYLPFCLN